MSMTIQEAIRALHLPGDHIKSYDEYGYGVDDELKDAMQMAIEALREKAEREDPKPLTIEELRDMIGEPIYIVHSHNGNEWQIFTGYNDCSFWSMGESFYLNCRYGKGWIAYRHKPKEAQK
ncbi:MAG: hypothetical protein J6Q53_04190 [Oscillospiraceae bacterium]|nr:hypothetical protein [Oscillospiraceae bacterium]